VGFPSRRRSEVLETVDVGERSLSAYRGVAPDALLDQLEAVAEPLRGLRVLQLNATPYGGGVSELLRSGVPLLNDLGLIVDWKVIAGDERFFETTKAIHNGLQGAARGLTDAERAAYLEATERNAALLEEEYDVVLVHDPQPAGILSLHGKGAASWVWRCHIDTGAPNPEVWEFVRGWLEGYDAAVFTMREFAPPDLPIGRVELIPPAIDALSPKNLDLPEPLARQVLAWIGIGPDRPLVTQVSRFDPWKDPLGVIAAYRLAREEMPDLQLALAGSMALDDPEGWRIYEEIRSASEGDPLVHVFTNLTGVGNVEVNAFQRLSTLVIQKSIREGFGLVVSEALWKGTPVVAGRAGGIPLQMADGAGGVLVDSVEECARAIVELIRDPERARELGARGRERVRERFLLPRLLLNELALVAELVAARRPVAAPWDGGRDPVCGMALANGDQALSTTFAGATYQFCSQQCLGRFSRDPDRYARVRERKQPPRDRRSASGNEVGGVP
jgi:trehalose synthase